MKKITKENILTALRYGLDELEVEYYYDYSDLDDGYDRSDEGEYFVETHALGNPDDGIKLCLDDLAELIVKKMLVRSK